MTRSAAGADREPGWRDPLHVLVLASFAVAQPTYDLLGRNPTFFVFRRWQPVDFFVFALVLSLALPALLAAGAEIVGAAGRTIRRRGYDLLVGLLAALVLLPWLAEVEELPAWGVVLVALVGGVGLAVARRRWLRLRQLLSWLGPSALLFCVAFLVRPGIREQWLPQRSTPSTAVRTEAARPIAMVVFDALPTTSLMDDRGGIDRLRYPNFARLAREGTWFRQATTVSTTTIAALHAILAGLCPPAENKPPLFSSFPRNLFTFFGGSHRFEVAESVTRLCPPDLCGDEERPPFLERVPPLFSDAAIVFLHTVLPRDWRGGLPAVDRAWGDFGDAAAEPGHPEAGDRVGQVAGFRRRLDRLGRTTPPALFFSHLVLPHAPYYFLPSGQRYRKTNEEPGGTWDVFGEDPWVAWHSFQRHLLQVGYADTLLGELLAKLDRLGLYDDTLIVVTADHGISFRPGEPRRLLTPTNGVDILPVPLLIKYPGQAQGEVRDDSVQTVDILPMVAEALQVSVPSWTDGRPLSGGERRLAEPYSCRNELYLQAKSELARRLSRAAARKVELFGTGAGAGAFPRVGPHAELVGARASDLACAAPGAVESELQSPEDLARVDPRSGFVPAEIVGLVRGPRAHEGVDLAVAVNGTVRATTRTYRAGAADAMIWSAIVPESAFREGHNDVEVFEIDPASDGCRLRKTRGLSEPLAFLDVRLGAWRVPRVKQTGFRSSTQLGGGRVRWTRGRGVIEVPLSPSEARRLRRVRIDLAHVGTGGNRLRVKLNRKKIFDGVLDPGHWSRTFEVGPWGRTGPVRIVLRSDVRLVEERKYGVAVEGIWLLSDAGESEPADRTPATTR